MYDKFRSAPGPTRPYEPVKSAVREPKPASARRAIRFERWPDEFAKLSASKNGRFSATGKPKRRDSAKFVRRSATRARARRTGRVAHCYCRAICVIGVIRLRKIIVFVTIRTATGNFYGDTHCKNTIDNNYDFIKS